MLQETKVFLLPIQNLTKKIKIFDMIFCIFFRFRFGILENFRKILRILSSESKISRIFKNFLMNFKKFPRISQDFSKHFLRIRQEILGNFLEDFYRPFEFWKKSAIPADHDEYFALKKTQKTPKFWLLFSKIDFLDFFGRCLK